MVFMRITISATSMSILTQWISWHDPH